MEKITEQELQEIEKNKYIKRNNLDYLFIMKNYGTCASFLNEILQTEGLSPEEFYTLNKLSALRTNFESRGGHWFALIYAFLHIRLFLKAKGNVTRFLIFLAYPTFAFDASYSLGRIFGNFIVMPYCFNSLLRLSDGNSIQALQTRLFVKRSVYEDILVKNNQKGAESWINSFVLRQIFGKAAKAMVELKDYSNRVVEYIKQ